MREALVGEDPTSVERIMQKIRPRGAFKPWGSAISAIEMALWDLAGKAANLPVHRLLGGHADLYYIPIAPHNVASPIGTVAAAQLCAPMNNFLVLEFHANDVPWWDDLVEGDKTIRDGFIELGEKPGHGLTLNEDVARAHVKPGCSCFGETA